MSEDAARREVRRAVEQRGGRTEFAEKAGVDPGTLGDFLDGKRWAQPRTRTKIEAALGWPAGWIMDLRDGIGVHTQDDVVTAILADPHLLPEAKDHLVKQYGLLLRVQQMTPTAEAVQETVTREHLAELRTFQAQRKAPAKTPAKKSAGRSTSKQSGSPAPSTTGAKRPK